MKNFEEWFSYQMLSKSLLSARPFSFFYDESPNGELVSQDPTVTSMPEITTSTHSSDSRRHVADESCDLSQYSTFDKSSDLLTRVETLQIKLLRVMQRIGQSPANPIFSQVLYRLQLASLIRAGEADVKRPTLKLDTARAIAFKLEATGRSNLDFSFKILILGKTGVGKSSTINSIFDQPMVQTDAFQPATNQIQEVTGNIKGINVTIIDTPGLLPSHHHQKKNIKILFQVKKFIRKSSPDIVLYLERLDDINHGHSDYRLLKLITDVFGASIWHHAIIGMTHSSSYPPDISYDLYTAHCTNLLQHHIHQAMQSTQLQNPVLLIENHPMCRKNVKGEKVLPNGQVWISQLLLLCAATKVLGDANTVLRFHDNFQLAKKRTRQPSLPHLLSSLLHPRHSAEDECNEFFDDIEDDEYDQLPPIRILTKAQYRKLSKEQRNAYLDELEYREMLYMKKQWNEELRRRKENNEDKYEDNMPHEIVQLPDITVPLNFDPDCPGYRYRCLVDSSDKWPTRPVLNTQGWDHDVGFDGISLEVSQDLKANLKASFVGQMSKDKEEYSIQSGCTAKYDDPMGRSLLTSIDIQGSEKIFVCTLLGDAKFRNLGFNTIGSGLTLTSFGKMCFVGAKVEDSVSMGRRFKLMVNAGRLLGCGQKANGVSMEAVLRGRDYPVRDDKVKFTASVLSFEKEVVFMGGFESDFKVSHGGKISFKGKLNSRRMGQVCLKVNTSEHGEIVLAAVVYLIQALFRGRSSFKKGWSSLQMYSSYER